MYRHVSSGFVPLFSPYMCIRSIHSCKMKTRHTILSENLIYCFLFLYLFCICISSLKSEPFSIYPYVHDGLYSQFVYARRQFIKPQKCFIDFPVLSVYLRYFVFLTDPNQYFWLYGSIETCCLWSKMSLEWYVKL